MVNNNKAHRPGIRAALSSALFLVATSASAVSVDGNLSDLSAAVLANPYPYNSASATDLLGSNDSPATETNNGFDIKDVYSFYDATIDTLYLGMNFYGDVGDSRASSDPAASEGTAPIPNANRNVFDSNESYSFVLYDGTSIETTPSNQLLAYYVVGLDNGGDAISTSSIFGISNIPAWATVTRSISESNNGVEFSVVGLAGQLGPFDTINPSDLLIRFGAGSSDLNTTSQGAEDSHLLQMQVIPVPATAWLLASGLMGLVGVSKRKRSMQVA